MATKKKKIDNIINSTAENFQQFIDANSVIGKPIYSASGFQIIPFSKVTMGNLSGGGEYGEVKMVKELDALPFAGGSGAVVSMKPMGFLIDDGTACRVVRITDEPLDNLIERATDIVRDVLKKE